VARVLAVDPRFMTKQEQKKTTTGIRNPEQRPAHIAVEYGSEPFAGDDDRVDLRNFASGREIPAEHYCDQAHVIQTGDGAWLCAITTGSGEEGRSGQHVVSVRSTDRGATWEAPVDVEPSDGPEASYSALLRVPSGRIYCFYNHNTDNLREVIGDDPPYAGGKMKRVDCQGYFVFKYSDDHGRSWSERRYEIPVREMEIDRRNPYQGKVRFFWNTGYAFSQDGCGYVPIHKVGRFGQGTYVWSEGALLCSQNILTEPDPEKIRWETFPEGEYGLSAPRGGGLVAEEQSFVPLGGSDLFVVYRTIDGFPCHSYSRDGGRTWEPPEYATYGPGRRRIKHPRAAGHAWPCANGKFLFWFHNNGTGAYDPLQGYANRNIAWLCGGDLDEHGYILWSEPEAAFYCDDRLRGASYPNFLEEDGDYFFAATQKHEARIMRLEPRIAAILHRDRNTPPKVVRDGLALELDASQCQAVSAVPAPELPPLTGTISHFQKRETIKDRDGFSIDLAVRFEALDPGQILLDTRDESGRGITIKTSEGGVVCFSMNDGCQAAHWECDSGLLRTGRTHRITVTVDGGAKLITYVIDGSFNDGGTLRPFGFGRFAPLFKAPNGSATLRIAPSLKGTLGMLRIYTRCLLTGEAVMNHAAS
jgi:hypothetical protein